MSQVAFVFRVTGRVQRVGFRWFAQATAAAAGVGGWIRNERDGSVAGEVAGDEAAVAAFLDALRRGPPGAAVAEVTHSPVAIGERPGGFVIRR